MAHSQWRTIPGFVHVGTLGKHYGTSGELRVRILPGLEEDVITAEFLFIDLLGSKVPFRVENWRQGKDLLVSFSAVEDRTDASGFSGCELYLPQDELNETEALPNDELRFAGLKDYTLVDANSGDEIGQIADVQSFPQQEMGVVLIDAQEVLIPLHEDLIADIDEAKRVVRMDIPDGLLDL